MHTTTIQKVDHALKRAGFVLHRTHAIEYDSRYCAKSVRVSAKPDVLRKLAEALLDEGFNPQICLRTSSIVIR